MEVVRCLVKALTHENARLKKQSVEAKLDNDMLEVAARNDAAAARREAAAPLKQVPCSGEHGRHWVWTAARCGTAAADRMTVSFAPSYARSLPFAGASAVAGCMAVAAGRIAPNHKKLRRLYAEERLQVRTAGNTRSAQGHTGPTISSQPALVARFSARPARDGRRFRILAVVDDFSRECLALVADVNVRAAGRRELDATVARRWVVPFSWKGERFGSDANSLELAMNFKLGGAMFPDGGIIGPL
jgi:hypothetical protein